jgi:hypothetical protein
VAAFLVLVVVMSITAIFSKPARAGAPAGGPSMNSGAEITPGLARAEADTLDLQLD